MRFWNGGGEKRIRIKTRAKADRIKLEKRVTNRKVCAKISCEFPTTQLKAGQSLRTRLKVKDCVGAEVGQGVQRIFQGLTPSLAQNL